MFDCHLNFKRLMVEKVLERNLLFASYLLLITCSPSLYGSMRYIHVHLYTHTCALRDAQIWW